MRQLSGRAMDVGESQCSSGKLYPSLVRHGSSKRHSNLDAWLRLRSGEHLPHSALEPEAEAGTGPQPWRDLRCGASGGVAVGSARPVTGPAGHRRPAPAGGSTCPATGPRPQRPQRPRHFSGGRRKELVLGLVTSVPPSPWSQLSPCSSSGTRMIRTSVRNDQGKDSRRFFLD